MSMRRQVTDAFKYRQHHIRRRNFKCKTLANQSGQFFLMFECINARQHPTRTVTKQKHRQSRFARLRELYHLVNVADVFRNTVDVEPLAVRIATATQIDGINSQTCIGKLIGSPEVITTV
jgi:hypothetical protein